MGPTQTFLRQPQSWNGPYDVLFADPPYAAKERSISCSASWQSVIVSGCAHDDRTRCPSEMPDRDGAARLIRRYAYGDTALFLYGPAMRAGRPHENRHLPGHV